MPSQQQASTTPADARDEWRTPPFAYEFMAKRYAFEIDLAATFDNSLCGYCYDRKTDALKEGWAASGAFVGFLNPPYSSLEPWLIKARNEAALGFTTVALLPTANGQLFYGRHVFGIASEVLFINGRLAFLDSSGKPRTGNTAGSMFVIYRGHDLGQTRYGHVWRDDMIKDWRTEQGDVAA